MSYKDFRNSMVFGLIFLISATAQAVQMKTSYTPIANLVYHLDCVSGAISSCSDKNYMELWKRDFLRSDIDTGLISAWRKTMNKYKVNAELAQSKSVNTSVEKESTDLSHKVRIASFEAKNMQDYLSRLDIVMQFSDRIEIEKIIKHFYPRFEKWWNKEAAGKGAKFSASTEALLKSKEIQKKIEQFAHFYEAELPADLNISLILFFRPELVAEPTSGQQLDNYALSEFVDGEDPKKRMDVVLHELCHFLFKSAEPKKFSSLKENFSKLKSVEATGAHNLLNEVLAATFGNGIVNKIFMPKDVWEKYLAHKNSFYNYYYIDTGAKAILPWLERWLEQGKTLYDPDFIPTYMESLGGSFGKKLGAPRVLLSDMIFVGDEKFKYDFESDLHKNLFMTYASWGDWNDKSILKRLNEDRNVNVLVVVHPDNFSKLVDNKTASQTDLSKIKKALIKDGSVLYAIQRGSSAMTYIIASSKLDSAVKRLEELGKLEAGFVGVKE